jgi:serine phosphatase RsbU (regulator of sigma subunit)
VVVAVADCTGHGVPGAFMSVIGIAYLNEIAREKNNQKTGKMLDKLRLELRQSLENSEYKADTKDGMDIALCAINTNNLTAQYSGAINNLYLIRDKNLVVYKGDHQHIGILDEEKDFTSFELQLKKDDILYMFTDGYVDQFGGKTGRKFLIKHFKQLLLEITQLPMEEQKTVLEKTLDDWQKGYQQVDDILVLGIKI